jgi:hypothetical protein
VQSDSSPSPKLHATGIAVAASQGGTSPHLVDLTTAETSSLCGVSIDFKAPCAWFGVSGCKKCAKTAIRRGLSEINDIDGEVVELQGVLARDW